MPNLVVYIPAKVWRRLHYQEGAAAKEVARAVAKRAIINHLRTSTPEGAERTPSGTSGVGMVTASSDSGVEILPPE